MPGEWGNIMKVKTGTSENSGISFYKDFVSRVLSVFPRQVTDAGNGSL